VLAIVLLLAGCSAVTAPEPQRTGAPTSSGTAVDAAALLAGLQVEREDWSVPYDRQAFGYGEGEFDPDGDGCWTKREVLIRDHVGPLEIGRSCRLTGEWRSVYDGRTTTDPDAFTLDHLVPLAEAWRSGAERWDADRLVAYGNDLGYRWSLLAVTQQLNEDKGDQDPATWLPGRDRCTYLAAWVAVKARWSLSVDRAELEALESGLDACGPTSIAAPGAPDLATLLP
jgi:hypothetical protein